MLARSELPTVSVRLFWTRFRGPVADVSVRLLVERLSERSRSWGIARGWKAPWIACRLESRTRVGKSASGSGPLFQSRGVQQ